MATPRTSIIMPVYNTAHDVVRAIDSVLTQTDPDFELLIINDQSPDNADEVITAHLDRVADERVRYLINDVNMGLAATRNRGIQESAGEWIACLDSDDAYKPNFLKIMHSQVTPQVDVVVCAHDVVYPDGTSRYRLRGSTGNYQGHDAMLKLLRDETTPYAWDKIFRRSTFDGLTFPSINRIEDAAYLVVAYQRAHTVVVIPDSLVLYSVNPESITWGSVPPIDEMYKYVEYLKDTTHAHRGSSAEQAALAVSWVGAFLNGAQSALRLQPDNLDAYLRDCRRALRWHLLRRTLPINPLFGAAGILLKMSPSLYKVLYGAYVRKMYGI